MALANWSTLWRRSSPQGARVTRSTLKAHFRLVERRRDAAIGERSRAARCYDSPRANRARSSLSLKSEWITCKQISFTCGEEAVKRPAPWAGRG
jgi:hypothetical protein